MNALGPAAMATVAAALAFADPPPRMAQATGEDAMITRGFRPFDTVDADLDGRITSAEFRRGLSDVDAPEQLFAQADGNGDDAIERREWAAWRERRTARVEAGGPQPGCVAERESELARLLASIWLLTRLLGSGPHRSPTGM
jgi:hypothetical protein